ncbi:MAG: hypothetical protein ACTSU9_10420, partial [Promethearchaeota archaeon]
MGTYYSYNCQVCGVRQYGKRKVRRCNFCNIALCRKCQHNAFCPLHDRVLLPGEKSKLRNASMWQDSSCCLSMVAFLVTLLLLIWLNAPGGVAFGVSIGVAIFVGFGIFKGSDNTWKKAYNEASTRLLAEAQSLSEGPASNPSSSSASGPYLELGASTSNQEFAGESSPLQAQSGVMYNGKEVDVLLDVKDLPFSQFSSKWFVGNPNEFITHFIKDKLVPRLPAELV